MNLLRRIIKVFFFSMDSLRRRVRETHRLSIAEVTLLAIALAVFLILFPIYWNSSLTELNEIEACSFSIPVCTKNSLCDDFNDCTLDRMCSSCGSGEDSYSIEDDSYCDSRSLANGIACTTDVCAIVDSGTCSAGICKGECAGVCAMGGTSNSNCPNMTHYLIPSLQPLLSQEFFLVDMFCDTGVCTLLMGDVTGISEFSLWPLIKNSDELDDESCRRLLDHSVPQSSCLTSHFSRIYAGPSNNYMSTTSSYFIDDNCSIPLIQSPECGGPCGPVNQVGACRQGIWMCQEAEDPYCFNATLPLEEEICNNGIDDNCNGEVDEVNRIDIYESGQYWYGICSYRYACADAVIHTLPPILGKKKRELEKRTLLDDFADKIAKKKKEKGSG